MNRFTNQASKEKIILLLLTICFSIWVISAFKTQISSMNPTAIGPFQYLPPIFWPVLLTVVYLNLIPSKPYLKFISMLMIGLITMGTLVIILPFGGAMTDPYVIVPTARLVFEYGTVDFWHSYPPVYPTYFIFHGALQEVLGVSTREIIRFYPLFVMIFSLFGIAILVRSICKHFNIKTEERLAIIGLSFLSFAVFMFSVGLRADPVPQAFALVLLPYFLASFCTQDAKWRAISIIIFFALATTHMMTSFIAIMLALCLQVFIDRRSLSRLMLPLVLWFGWVIYIAIGQFEYAINYILSILQLEAGVGEVVWKATGLAGLGVPGVETYLFLRRLTIILIGILLLFSFLYLLKKKRKLAFLLLGFLAACSTLLFFWFTIGAGLLSRWVEISAVFASLVLGFGLYEVLKNLVVNGKKWQMNLRVLVPQITVVLILITSFLSILTAGHQAVIFARTESQTRGYEFTVFRSDEPIYSGFPFILEYYATMEREKAGASDVDALKDFAGIIAISEQRKNLEQAHERREITPLMLTEEWLNKSPSAARIYDNGSFQAYLNYPR